MNQRVGTCSICGGDVVGFRGAWWSILPPPPDVCSQCGGRSKSDVVEMVPAGPRHAQRAAYTSHTITVDDSSKDGGQ